jgi:hypothetical protein
MAPIREEFRTNMSVQQCEGTFRQAVQRSYSPGRKVISALGSLRGSTSGGVEFFEPPRNQIDASGRAPDWQLGALVPGHSKMHGATKVGVHIYVVDEGETRFVTLVGAHNVGEKGSTDRLVKSIHSSF